MAWGLSTCLAEDERILDNSIPDFRPGLGPLYTVCLTQKRVLFRFNPLRSGLCKAFMLADIDKAFVARRFFVNYVGVEAENKTHYFRTSEPEYWAVRINELSCGSGHHARSGEADSSIEEKGRRSALLRIFYGLRKKSVITEPELREKVQRLGP